MISERWRTITTRQGGDGANTLGYNLGAALGAIHMKEHLLKSGSRLWCDCTDGPPEGSVLGNALERGMGVTQYADHFATLCGLEIVLADGSIIRTGGGAFGRCPTWNTHKWGVGPYIEGLFSQSNFGIVVKAGIWLFPEPE